MSISWDREHKIYGGHRVTKIEPGHYVKTFGATNYFFTKVDRTWVVDVFGKGGRPRVHRGDFDSLTEAVQWAFEQYQEEAQL